MKKWLYFIAPIAGIGLFLFFYFAHVEEAKKAAAEKKARIEAADLAEKQRKAELEAIARDDATKKAAERAEQEAKKEAEKVATWAKAGAEIQEAIDDATSISSKHTAAIGSLEKKLAGLHSDKEQANREYLEAIRQLEMLKIERRKAELEIQRLTTLLIDKAEESAKAVALIPETPAAK